MRAHIEGRFGSHYERAVRRRKAAALMLALSMAVTSGVSWGLRGTGITMVNETLCELEEHRHTDECYENVNICGLEEGEEHTHTEDCFELSLVCGFEEHSHDADCYAADGAGGLDILAREPMQTVSIDGIPSDAEDEYGIMTMAADEYDIMPLADTVPPPKYDTDNNREDGILINFFDYGDGKNDPKAEDELELGTNAWDRVTYNNGSTYNGGVKYVGINGGDWIHNPVGVGSKADEGKQDVENLLFYAYGTPSFAWQSNGDGKVNPSLNNYSGSWSDSKHAVNGPVSGNRPVQGIVNGTLDGNGYPTLANNDQSLSYLFDTTPINDNVAHPTKKVYENVSYLMKKNHATGQYQFVSDDHYAYLQPTPVSNAAVNKDGYDKTTGYDFLIYDGTYTIDVHEDTADGRSGPTDEHNGRPIGFFPFDKYPEDESADLLYSTDGSYTGKYRDPTHYTRYTNNNHRSYSDKRYDYDHHFGMTMEVEFNLDVEHQTYKGNDIEFSYSGDDDMWVFVDGVLILDLGGIHEPAAGQINFTDGYVLTQDNAYGDLTIEDLNNYNGKDLLTGDILTKYMRGSEGDTMNQGVAKMNYETIADVYNRNKDSSKPAWNAVNTHTLKVFYLERGGSYSNLALEFNLPLTKELTVEKEVQDINDLDDGDKAMDFEYILMVKEDGSDDFQPWGNAQYYLNGNKGEMKYTGNDGSFTLKHGETATFPGMEIVAEYYIIEKGIDGSLFGNVDIVPGNTNYYNPESYRIDENETKATVTSAGKNGHYVLNENDYVKFVNRVRKDSGSITVNKQWQNSNGSTTYPTDITVHFRLIRTDEAGVETVIPWGGWRTFALPDENGSWSKTFTDLPTKVGRHTYTYRVEELDCPDKYTPSYSEDGLTVTNISIDNAEIHTEKTWDLPAGMSPDDFTVNVKIKRKYKEAKTATPATVTINFYDAEDSETLLDSQTVEGVYLNGAFEFRLPEGIECYRYGKSNCDVELFGSVFDVSKIQDGATIDLYVKGGVPGAGSNWMYYEGFESGTGDWNGHGAATVSRNTNTKHSGNGSLYVTGRTDTWQGAEININTIGLEKGKTYTVSAYVYLTYEGNNPDPQDFKLTLNNPNESSDANKYMGFAEVRSASVNQWTQITGTITIPEYADGSSVIYIEGPAVSKREGGNLLGRNYNYNFYVDDFVIVEGEHNVDVVGGNVTIDGQPTAGSDGSVNPIFHHHFDNGTDGWEKRGNSTVQRMLASESQFSKPYATNGRLNVKPGNNFSSGYNGAVYYLDTNVFKPGVEYSFHAMVMGTAQGAEQHIIFQVCYVNGNNDTYGDYIDEITIPAGDNGKWFKLENPKFMLDASKCNGSDTKIYIFMQTEQEVDMHIDEVVAAPGGCTISVDTNGNATVLAEASSYGVEINPNSITKPMNIDPNSPWVDDATWNESQDVVTLTKNNQGKWTWSWSTGDLNQQGNRIYRYYVEEIGVFDKNGKDISDVFETTYTGGGQTIDPDDEDTWVSSNTADNPIVICNKYIAYELPSTGGMGTDVLYGLGVVLTTLGLSSGYTFNRRRKRQPKAG